MSHTLSFLLFCDLTFYIAEMYFIQILNIEVNTQRNFIELLLFRLLFSKYLHHLLFGENRPQTIAAYDSC